MLLSLQEPLEVVLEFYAKAGMSSGGLLCVSTFSPKGSWDSEIYSSIIAHIEAKLIAVSNTL